MPSLLVAVLLSAVGCGQESSSNDACSPGTKCDDPDPSSIDGQLRELLAEYEVEALERESSYSSAMLELGQALYFDKELSGNRDISCATCHHPLTMTGDMLSLPIGVGGDGLGPDRNMGEGRERIPRNAPDIYNRGSSLWTTMFWDNRVVTQGYSVESPAGAALPSLLETPLQAQAMFPPTSAAEMRGSRGDYDVFGEPNELAAIADDDVEAIWDAIRSRLVAIDDYVDLFGAAFDGLDRDSIRFEHAAIAIAAFEDDAFTFVDSDFDRYLRGDDAAMTADAKRGALLFYGKAGCANCHSGPLLTDQQLHNICSPQAGPGRGAVAPEDIGGFAVTGNPRDKYAFRTPSLRNVIFTGPWMHAGTYTDLEQAVRHHLDVQASAMSYDASQLSPELEATVVDDPAVLRAMLETLDPDIAEPRRLSDQEVDQLMDFLLAVTDLSAADLAHVIPVRVPSGLPVND